MKKLITFAFLLFANMFLHYMNATDYLTPASNTATIEATLQNYTGTDVVITLPSGYTGGYTGTSTINLNGLTGVTNIATLKLAIIGDGNTTISCKTINLPTTSKTLRLQGINFSSSSLSGTYLITNANTIVTTIDSITFKGCTISTYTGVVRTQNASTAYKNILIDNCVIRNIYNYGVVNTSASTTASTINSVAIKNSSIYGVSNSIFLHGGSLISGGVSISDCTFDNLLGAASGNYFIDLGAYATPLTITNTILGKAYNTGNKGIRSGTTYTVTNSYKTTDWGTTGGGAISDLTSYTNASTTLFKTPTTPSNFTLTSQTCTTGDYTINDASFLAKSSCGDPRWYYPLTVTPSVTTLSGFSYTGSGPSTSQSFTVSAVALRTAITLTAPIDYELSTDNISFSGSVSIGTAGSDMADTPVYVRLKAGLAYAAYNNEQITIATTGMTNKTVSCSGNVLSGRTVLTTPDGLSVSGITGSGFTASWNAVAHASSYTVNVYQGASSITSVSGISGTTTDITTNLISGNTYTYKVMAIGDGSFYDNSLESSASATLRLSGSYATDPFRTKASGSYSDLATWQSSPDGGSAWENATLIPDVNASSVSILHDVTYAGSPATIGNVSVSSGVTLTNTTTAIAVAASKTLTIAGGATLDNQIDNATFSAGSGSVQVNGTYKVSAYTGGTQLAFSNVTFASGSTLYIGCPGAPRLPASNGGNVVWASAAGGSFLQSNPTTIAGNLTMTSALVNALNNGSGNTVRVLTISGNLTINGGVYNPQGGSGTGTQAVTVNGDVYLSGVGKLYAVNPLAAGLGTVDIKGNVYIQSPTDVALAAGGATGTITLSGTSQQTVSTNLSTGYSIDGLTVSNTTGVLINSNLSASNITINASSILGVAAGKQLTANGSLVNNGTLNLLSDATGTATILTPSTISGAGTANVQQYLPAGRNSYISSPVTAATTTSLSSATSVVSYNEPTASWITESGSLTPLKGYISVNNSTSGNVTFNGTLNNGDLTITPTRTTGQTKEGFNLVGNPYPSYVNWDAAIKTNLLSTMWYRTKSASAYVFDTYNSTGGVATSNGLTTVSNLIPPMQAFWVRVDAGQTSGTLSFTNAMRSHADVSSNSFKAPAAAKASQPVLRLQVSNGTNSDETVVYFNANASNGYDAYDSPKITNANAAIPEIYTTEATEQLAINGLNSIPYNQELPLGFTTGESNSFTIKTTEFSNFDASTKVYLRDKVWNKELELTDGTAYSFASDITSTTNQFAIIFKSAGVATSLNNTDGNQTVLVYKNANNQIAVTCKGNISSDATVSVYNAVGQKLQMKQITSNSTVINTVFTSGVYVITVNNAGKSNTKKVILN